MTEPVEVLRLCDPAAGSGHMLTYAFDLLYAIYEEEGYTPSEIPTLILRHNLYGMEIDERAGALAAFALTMKARSRDRGFFNRGIHPNICVLKPITISAEEVDGLPWLQALAATLDGLPIRDALIADLNRVAQLDNIGSLLRPQLKREQIARLRKAMTSATDLLNYGVNERLAQVLKQLEYLARKYHVVVANPPYMGGNANDELKDFARSEYPDSKSDLFAMFMERGLDLVLPDALVAMVTMQSWMFLSSYEALREKLLDTKSILTLIQIGYNSFPELNSKIAQACAFVIQNSQNEVNGYYLNLNDAPQSADKDKLFLRKLKNGEIYQVNEQNFKKIPGRPIAYWSSNVVFNCFDFPLINQMGQTRRGLQTGNSVRFIRYWFETQHKDSGYKSSDSKDQKWFLMNNGGAFRKWYGNTDYVVNWKNDGEEIKATGKAIIPSEYLYFQRCVTWSRITSSRLSFRLHEQGVMPGDIGPCIYSDGHDYELLGLLNSNVADHLLKIINPTITMPVGDVAKVPNAIKDLQSIKTLTTELVSLSKADWDAYETSWNFTTLPLLDPTFRGPTLAATYATLRAHWQTMTDEMQRLEETNNRLFIDAYGLQDELTPDVPLAEITLTCNPHYRYSGNRTAAELEALLLADTMREFISYAVGCLFGRYSLDKPGLILANQGETVGEFVGKVFGESAQSSVLSHQLAVDSGQSRSSALNTENWSLKTGLLPDADNVIPILDEGDWFVDDLCARVQGFLRLTFGEKNYAENLRFIEEALGRDLRGYLLRDFYNDHVRRYQKRPIYWLFSSANGSFNALIYLHRYRPDTPSVVLNDYLREFRTKLTAERDHQAVIAIDESAPARERTRAQKQLDRFAKILAELQEYEDEVLYPLATQQIALDLDDGVKVNYQKLGKALKKVSGLSG